MAQASLLMAPYYQAFDNNGDPLSGGTVEFYAAGLGAPKAVYGDSAETINLGAVVTLDSSGRAAIWLDGYYYVRVKDSLGNIIRNEDNVSSAYSPAAVAAVVFSEWQSQTDVLTYIGATQFSVPTDKTLVYTVGRRIKATVTAGTITGTITVSSFAAGITTVTVLWDLAQALDAGLSAVWTGIISPIASGTPYQIPIGAIVDWYKTMVGVPALCYGWVQCDGQTLADALSPMNGQVIPNLNGAAAGADTFTNGKIAVYLRGGTVSGTYSADSVIAHNHGLTGAQADSHQHGPGTLTTDATLDHTHTYDKYQNSLQDVAVTGASDNVWQDTSVMGGISGGAGAHSHTVDAGWTDLSGALGVTGPTDNNGAATETTPKTVTAVKILRIK